MPTREVKVRFAPSPTGDLHLGTARIAVLNWLYARHYGGQFLLRFEDTDAERSEVRYVESILSDLGWMGIVSDDSPVFQSQRADIHSNFLQVLLKDDNAYPCFCTDDELRAEREKATAKGRPPRYSGRCRILSATEIEQKARETDPSYRIKVPKGGTSFQDMLRGEMQFPESAFDDFVIMRSNGVASYNFAVVLDDHEMGISHVLRGEDHLSNTARQQVVANALGIQVPEYMHVGLVVGEDGSKLSKRDGATSLNEFRDKGFSSEAVLNYVALLGWSSASQAEVFTPKELCDAFEWERLSTSPGRWDPAKLKWIAREHFRRMSPVVLANKAMNRALEQGMLVERSVDWWQQLTTVFQGELFEVGQLVEQAGQYSGSLRYPDEVAARFSDLLTRNVLSDYLSSIRGSSELTEARAQESIEMIKKQFKDQGVGPGKVMLPLRLALTAQKSGPELRHCVFLLGRDGVMERLNGALDAAPERTGNG